LGGLEAAPEEGIRICGVTVATAPDSPYFAELERKAESEVGAESEAELETPALS
jgi:hypothetical protein